MYVAIIILAFWQNILLDIYTGKDTFQAIKQAYIVGCIRIKHNSEEIMEKELHSRSEQNWTDPFWYGALWFTTFHICTRNSPFIVSPAHSKDQVYFCAIMLNSKKALCSSDKSP